MEKRKYKELEVTQPNFQLVNKPSRISTNEILRSRLINTVYHLLVKNNEGEERGRGLNEKEAYLLSFPEKGGGGVIRENRGFTVDVFPPFLFAITG